MSSNTFILLKMDTISVRFTGSYGRKISREEKDIENIKKQSKEVFHKDNKSAEILANYIKAAPLHGMNVTLMTAAIYIYQLYISNSVNLSIDDKEKILTPELMNIILKDEQIVQFMNRYYNKKGNKSNYKTEFTLNIIRYLDYLIDKLPNFSGDFEEETFADEY